MSNRNFTQMQRAPLARIDVRDAMDRLFNENFFNSPFRSVWGSGFDGGNGPSSRSGIALDVYETEDEVVIIAAVPGLGPDDINVSVHDNTVTLSGQLPNVAQSAEAREATWYIHELPYGSFQRSLKLPVEIDPDAADATFDNGILHLHLPKATQVRPRQITVRRSEARIEPETPLALPEEERAERNGSGKHSAIGEPVAQR
ncbi:MAG TPA: Hsp20/alpha crystallin family protein [Thermomicrobiales bacterium]|jgi:HSP20 family protein|nr:Hsp20/alpha crystallin family protein [Thermomicrobiales bacterium]